MSRIERTGDTLRFSGPLVRSVIPALWWSAQSLLDDVRRLDLSATERIDSAGLAMPVELVTRIGPVRVEGTPPGLNELRAAYRLSPALTFTHS